jgi:HCOMODA/2-hydroxy-3-carboxy-muconic semialdehyde decarboxylase
VAANRILVDQGVVDGYGHVSVRHDKSADRYLMSRSIAPELVTAADIMEYDLDSVPVDPQGRAMYLERFIHGEIYRIRPDVRAIVHNHSPSVIPFVVTGAQPCPLYHMSVPVARRAVLRSGRRWPWTGMLIRTLGRGFARSGQVPSPHARPRRGRRRQPSKRFPKRTGQRAARQALAVGGPVTYLDTEVAKKAQASLVGTIPRPWELWKRKALAAGSR